MRNPTKLVAALLLGLTFVVGGLTGMALEEALGIDWFEFLDEDYGQDDDRLLTGLDLTRDQQARAERILEREEDRLEDYWEERLPEIQGILQETYGEIRGILTPAQQERFDQRLRELGSRVPEEFRD